MSRTRYTYGSASLDVDTGACNYLTVTAPLLEKVSPRDVLGIYVSHDVLTAEEPALAHVAIQIGDWVALDGTVPIPALNDLLLEEIAPPRAFAAGTPVWYHLHNHGENTWNMYEPSLVEQD